MNQLIAIQSCLEISHLQSRKFQRLYLVFTFILNCLILLENRVINYGVLQIQYQMQKEAVLAKLIKKQQAQILNLESLLKQNNSQEKQKLEATIRELHLVIDLKQKQIDLKNQQLIGKELELQQVTDDFGNYKISSKIRLEEHLKEWIKEKEMILLENAQQQIRIRELENKIRVEAESAQTQINKVIQTNSNLLEQISKLKEKHHNIEIQTQKLNTFYRKAVSQSGKRLETSEWVENLISFVKQFQESIRNHPYQIQVQRFNSELQKCVEEFKDKTKQIISIHQQKHIEISNIKKQIESLAHHIQRSNQNMGKQYKQFIQIIDSNRTFNDRLLQEQLKQQKESIEKTIQSTNSKLQQADNEKKQLMLALQQTKNYYENRQRTFKEQIKLLKNAEIQLIEYGEKREELFEKEIQKLLREVDMVYEIYQKNINIPFRQLQRTFATEIRGCLNQISQDNFRENFATIVSKLELKIKETEIAMNRVNERQLSLQQTYAKNLSQLEEVQKNLCKSINFMESTVSNYGNERFSEDQFDNELNTLQQTERQFRKSYELDLLRKNYNRLSEINKKLEGNLEMIDKIKLNRKIAELENQRNHLLQIKQAYENKFCYGLKRLKFVRYDLQIFQVIAQNLYNFQSSLAEIKQIYKNGIDPIRELEKISIEEYFLHTKNLFGEVLKFVQNPIKKLEEIASKQIQNITLVSRTPQVTNNKIMPTLNFTAQIKAFKELISSKHQNGLKISKLLAQLITKIKPQTNQNKVQGFSPKNIQKSKSQINIERKIKELVSAHLKQKSDTASAIGKINQALKKIQTHKSKSERYVDIFTRIQIYLKEKFNYITIHLLQNPNNQKQVADLDSIIKKALADLQSKFKDAAKQIQGLTKELKVLNTLRQ